MIEDNLFEREESKGVDKLYALKIDIERKQAAKRSTQTVEETHKRQTYLIDKELIKRFDKLAKKEGRGFKTLVINSLLESYLNEAEKKEVD